MLHAPISLLRTEAYLSHRGMYTAYIIQHYFFSDTCLSYIYHTFFENDAMNEASIIFKSPPPPLWCA